MALNFRNTQKGEIQIYKTDSGTEIDVKLVDETIWLDAHLMATLFEVNCPAIVKHIQNIYKSGELEESSTCSNLEQVAANGEKRRLNSLLTKSWVSLLRVSRKGIYFFLLEPKSFLTMFHSKMGFCGHIKITCQKDKTFVNSSSERKKGNRT